MRELSVYYCPKCGHYSYYQLVRNAVCPACGVKMQLLDMRYQDFMHLGQEARDELLIHEILSRDPSVSNRIAAAERAHNTRRIIAAMNTQIQELKAENTKLNETVEWMHQTIWDLLARNKALERRLGIAKDADRNPDK